MNLPEKIELLKIQLKELDQNLKEVETACRESSDCFRQVDKSIGENVDYDDVKVLADLQKRVIANQIDKYRIHSSIIRKLSPETANFLDLKINECEKNCREFFDVVINHEAPRSDHVRSSENAKTSLVDIENMIFVSRTITRDILTRFEH